MTDVIIHIHYTSVNGGDKLKVLASSSVIDYIKNVQNLGQHDGLFTAFDLITNLPMLGIRRFIRLQATLNILLSSITSTASCLYLLKGLSAWRPILSSFQSPLYLWGIY